MQVMKKRTAALARKTKETEIAVELNLDGEGLSRISTGIPFMNHMLELLAKHSAMDLRVRAKGDLEVDYHHTVEDLGLVLGDAVNAALGDRAGIYRYGWTVLPMDDALARVALDLGGRPYLVYEVSTKRRKIRDFDLGLIKEFFRALATQARMNLHIRLMYGDEPHHAYEAVFKAVARALRMAVEPDPRARGIPSSKGRL
jgi:imidazoleglycerol-phosphate dehydratase